MRKIILRVLSIIALAIGVLVLITPTAIAEKHSDSRDRCVPVGGTFYGWHTSVAWFATGNFTVDRKVHHVDLVDINTSFFNGGDIWTGTETATFDFGRGDSVQLSAEFVTEHMNDAVASSGVFHINEIGTFTKGTGRFKNAYGHWIMQGPFGPNVPLPGNIQPPPDADMFWIGQYHGTICGIR
jgi:hypothetical protein